MSKLEEIVTLAVRFVRLDNLSTRIHGLHVLGGIQAAKAEATQRLERAMEQ